MKLPRVRFQGQEFWLVEGPEGDAAIAPLDHFDEKGRLTSFDHIGQSYAHLWADGRIKRHGEVIGTRADIEVLEPAAEAA